jgi:hypothetical protein
MSCLRLAGLSEGEVEFLAWASPAQRWLANLALASRELARRSGMPKQPEIAHIMSPMLPRKRDLDLAQALASRELARRSGMP